MICHICESECEGWMCRDCGEVVCEDCCVPYTQFNQIDFALCQECGDANNDSRIHDYERKETAKALLEAEKEKKRITRHAIYWMPENIAKRQKKKAERAERKREFERQRALKVLEIVSSIFKGMR